MSTFVITVSMTIHTDEASPLLVINEGVRNIQRGRSILDGVRLALRLTEREGDKGQRFMAESCLCLAGAFASAMELGSVSVYEVDLPTESGGA